MVREWMFLRPLPYLTLCRYPGVLEIFSLLKIRGIPVAIFSDYPANEKIKALGIGKPDVIVCATDSEVDRLKPHPKGLIVAAKKLKVNINQCLYIGDRDDKDGQCARRAGMPYLILNRNKRTRNADGFGSFEELAECLRL